MIENPHSHPSINEQVKKIESLIRNYPLSSEALDCYNHCLCGRPGPNTASWENGWDSALMMCLRYLRELSPSNDK